MVGAWATTENIKYSTPAFPHNAPFAVSTKMIQAYTYSLVAPTKHINNLCTNWHGKAFHAIVDTLLALPRTRHFTPIHASTQHRRQPQNTLPTWLLPSYCFVLKCKCLAKLCHDILCVKGESPTYSPPFIPHNSITIQFIEFTFL